MKSDSEFEPEILSQFAIVSWLEKIDPNLSQYSHNFIEHGFNSIESIKEINMKEELYAIGIESEQHCKVLFDAIKPRMSITRNAYAKIPIFLSPEVKSLNTDDINHEDHEEKQRNGELSPVQNATANKNNPNIITINMRLSPSGGPSAASSGGLIVNEPEPLEMGSTADGDIVTGAEQDEEEDNDNNQDNIHHHEQTYETLDDTGLFIGGSSSNNYSLWNWRFIYDWILSLDNGAFIKYKDEIENTLAEEEWHGSDLVEVTKEDIKRLGIIMFKDINSLYKHIEKLTMKEGIKKKKHDREISSNMSNMTISAFEYSKPDISMLVSDGNSVRL